MKTDLPRQLLEIDYDREAEEYCRSLPLEHFMEATDQSRQREITLESLALLKARRSDVHVFNELLIQYPIRGRRKTGKVVPDNMIVITNKPIRARGSYNIPLEPAPPFMVMEYVSKGNPRKDYKDSFRKYERALKVPYYLLFYPETQDLTLFRHNKEKYVAAKPNKRGRYTIPQLDLEIGLLDGWVRYWYEGKLLPLPEDLQSALDEAQQRAETEKQRADELQKQLDAVQQELAALKGKQKS